MSWLRAAAQHVRFERARDAIPELDGLRGLAVLLVVARHSSRMFEGRDDPLLPVAGWDAATLFTNGWLGVDLFFVLSGFLIGHHLLKASSSRFSDTEARAYILKRILRIVPTYYAVLLGVALLAPGARAAGSPVDISTLVFHLLFLQDYTGVPIVPAFWSLGVEEKFYLLIPFLLVWVGTLRTLRRRLVLLLLLALVGPLIRGATFLLHGSPDDYARFFQLVRSPFHLNLDALLIGVVCAHIYRHRAELDWTRRSDLLRGVGWGAASLMVGLLAATAWLNDIALFEATLLTALFATGAGALLLSLVLRRSSSARVLRGPALHVCSVLSYPLYLVHMPLVAPLYRWLELHPGFVLLPPGIQLILHLATLLAVAGAVALFVHLLVEKPFLRLKGRVGLQPSEEEPRILLR